MTVEGTVESLDPLNPAWQVPVDEPTPGRHLSAVPPLPSEPEPVPLAVHQAIAGLVLPRRPQPAIEVLAPRAEPTAPTPMTVPVPRAELDGQTLRQLVLAELRELARSAP